MQENVHLPVLAKETLQLLAPKPGESYLDVTAGYGGHASAVLALTETPEKAVLIDRDQNSVEYLQKKFASQPVHIMHQDYLAGSEQLLAEGKKFDLILADLGVSSPHLDNPTRGFSFRFDSELDMRMDQSQELTAADIVNGYSLEELISILREYGEEPKARRVAETIVAARPIHTTSQLAELIAKLWPPHSSRVHPATRTFQALRIAVNDELGQLQKALPIWLQLLQPGGRIAIISFHSLEDRMVKQFFAEHGGERFDAELQILTKKAVVADHQSSVFQPRERSAKLRAAEKK